MAKVWLVIERDYDGIQSFRAFSDPVKAEAFVAESIPEVKLEIEEMDIDADVGRAFRRCWVGWLRLIDREARNGLPAEPAGAVDISPPGFSWDCLGPDEVTVEDGREGHVAYIHSPVSAGHVAEVASEYMAKRRAAATGRP